MSILLQILFALLKFLIYGIVMTFFFNISSSLSCPESLDNSLVWNGRWTL